MEILQGHTSPESAHITFDYPFGRSIRCLRREWIERADKGSARGQYRFVTQTTDKAFNAQYTQCIQERSAVYANMKALELLQSGAVRWNAPKASTYTDFMVMVAAPLDDGSGRIGVSHEGLGAFCGPERLRRFYALADQLTNEQQARLAWLEKLDRRGNAPAWEKFDAEPAA